MLHTISKSLSQLDSDALLAMLMPDDVVLLMQDGVINGLAQGQYWQKLNTCGAQFYALEADLLARGLKPALSEQIGIVDYDGFVQLTVMHTPQMAW